MMKVFASRFLEPMTSNANAKPEDWKWQPYNVISEIYGSGKSTKTKESTYAAEKDSRGDSDRPNEGSKAA